MNPSERVAFALSFLKKLEQNFIRLLLFSLQHGAFTAPCAAVADHAAAAFFALGAKVFFVFSPGVEQAVIVFELEVHRLALI